MDCSNPRFYSLLLNHLFLVLYVADYFYLNLILCTFPYNIVPYWFMSVSSIYHNQLALWNVCNPISSYHVLGLRSVLIFLHILHSSVYRCSWKCVPYMKLLTGEVFHIWQMLLQFCNPLLMCRWCFAQWIPQCSFQWFVVHFFTDQFWLFCIHESTPKFSAFLFQPGYSSLGFSQPLNMPLAYHLAET